jgi:hypothetical protein
MIRVPYHLDNLPLEVSYHNDGEPMSIECEGLDVQRHFTELAIERIYAGAWESHTDPGNEADFWRGK